MVNEKVCLYSNPEPQYYNLMKKKGLNLEECCNCNGNGDAKDCIHRFEISKEFKDSRLHEQLELYHKYKVFVPVRS